MNAIRSLGCGVAALLLFGTASAQRPAVFADLDYPTARAAATASGKLLVLDAMTSWCGPCKVMDKTTWVDAELVAWLEKHAICIQLDMDEHESVKTGLGINAFPTIVLFQGGKEFDRVVGLKTADEMSKWLGGALSGKTDLDRAKAELDRILADPAAVSLQDHLKVAGELLSYGEDAAATERYVWLWKHRLANRPERQGVLFQMQSLAKKHAPAKHEFAALRGEIDPANCTREHLLQWIDWNQVLGDDAKTIVWAKSVAAREPAKLRGLPPKVFRSLVAANAWVAAGHTLGETEGHLRFLGENLGAYDIAPTAAKAGKITPGKAMPAIPMMAPSQPKPAGKAPKPRKGMMPAIPMGAAPKKRAVPMGAAPKPRAPSADGGKAMPAIPMVAPSAKRGRPRSKEEVAAEVRRRLTHQFRMASADCYGALLAAGRDREAEQAAEILLEHVDDLRSRAALVAAALRAGCVDKARNRHVEWLKDH